jgi:hypothetical protein
MSTENTVQMFFFNLLIFLMVFLRVMALEVFVNIHKSEITSDRVAGLGFLFGFIGSFSLKFPRVRFKLLFISTFGACRVKEPNRFQQRYPAKNLKI